MLQLRLEAQIQGTVTCVVKTFLPVLSAQLMTAPTGRPKAMRNLAPADPPRPVKNQYSLS